jgi:hypothetical protein
MDRLSEATGDVSHGAGKPDPRLGRVLREAGVPDLLPVLAERLSPADLTTLLLAVYRLRAAAVTPGRLLERYERDRFAAPSALDPAELARLDVLVHERLTRHGFTGVELSPVCPLGTNAAVATVDQNKVLTTVRAARSSRTRPTSWPSNAPYAAGSSCARIHGRGNGSGWARLTGSSAPRCSGRA